MTQNAERTESKKDRQNTLANRRNKINGTLLIIWPSAWALAFNVSLDSKTTYQQEASKEYIIRSTAISI